LYQDDLPNRVRVVVIGGGIHGVAVLHDLVSRGWQDVILLEGDRLGSGASSRSQKFAPCIPGSSEAWTASDARMLAREAQLLSEVAPDLCQETRVEWRCTQSWLRWVATGTAWLSGFGPACHNVDDTIQIRGFLFDDLGFVRRVAHSAKMLGAKIIESTYVDSITMDEDGWIIKGRSANGEGFKLGALFVVNCAGQGVADLLERSRILPGYSPTFVHEIFLLADAPEFVSALVWRSRNGFPGMRFAVPWHKMLIIGPWRMESDELERDFARHLLQKGVTRLLEEAEQLGLTREAVFSGYLRKRLFVDPVSTSLLNWTNRSIVGEMKGKRGSLFTLYGGSFLSFRYYARQIGDRIMLRFGERRPSLADSKQAWFHAGDDQNQELRSRFEYGGCATDSVIDACLQDALGAR
jgi:glycerol-3-phosphate dehydrogenase